MVRHFIIMLNAKTGELIHGVTTTKRGEWIEILFSMIKGICELNLQSMVEIVHVGTEKHGKTFYQEDIEKIGKIIMSSEEKE